MNQSKKILMISLFKQLRTQWEMLMAISLMLLVILLLLLKEESSNALLLHQDYRRNRKKLIDWSMIISYFTTRSRTMNKTPKCINDCQLSKDCLKLIFSRTLREERKSLICFRRRIEFLMRRMKSLMKRTIISRQSLRISRLILQSWTIWKIP